MLRGKILNIDTLGKHPGDQTFDISEYAIFLVLYMAVYLGHIFIEEPENHERSIIHLRLMQPSNEQFLYFGKHKV